MERLIVGAVAAAALAAALPAVAPGAARPPYTASCTVGSVTRADWQHAKLAEVDIAWAAPAGSGASFAPVSAPVPSPTPPHGFVSTPTPGGATAVVPASATFTFVRTDGSVDTLTVACG